MAKGKMGGLASGNAKGGGPKPSKAAGKPDIKRSTKVNDKSTGSLKGTGKS